jgi:predicted phosphoribosyltransferase
MLVRKLQIPDQPEAGFGAVTLHGNLLLNKPLVKRLRLSESMIEGQKKQALESIETRLSLYGDAARLPEFEGRTVILVDDGLASGFTMQAAIEAVKNRRPSSVVVAVPTSSLRAYRALSPMVDDFLCPDVSRLPIFAVANAYRDWHDLEDEEVLAILESARDLMRL